MSKIKILKIGGFIGTMAAGAAMIGAAVTGTGAYFTDSKSGGFIASSGHLTLNTTDANLRFDDLLPGEDAKRSIDFNVDSEGKSDVWLVFDPTDVGYKAFTSAKTTDFPEGGLGRFGHFAVSEGGTSLFESWNLAFPTPSTPPAPSSAYCDVDADGHGHGRPATSRADTPPWCGVPAAIKVASNLSSGQGGVLNLTFGITGRATGQHSPVASVPFKVVATQAGVRPDASNY